MKLKEVTISANTGLDAIKRALIVEENTGIKCIRIQDISKKKEYDDWGNTLTTEKDYKNFKLEINDLLVARTGATVGVSYLVKKDYNAVFNNGSIRLRLNDKVNTRFVYYIFQTNSFRQYIDNVSCVATQPNLRVENLLRFNIPDIEKRIQDSIVSRIEKLDDLIECNVKRIKVLEEMAEKLYKEWFVRFRFPGYETMEFEVKSPKGWILGDKKATLIPSNWHYGELKEIGEFIRGKNITADKMIEGEVPVISAGISPSGYHNVPNVFGGCITISASGANAGYLLYHLNDIWVADCSYYQNSENLWFVYNSLKFLQPVISNMQAGAAQPHVYPKHVNRICMIIPEKKWISKYCEIVSPIYDEIKVLKKKNDNLIKQRDLLLPRLMSGKLEV